MYLDSTYVHTTDLFIYIYIIACINVSLLVSVTICSIMGVSPSSYVLGHNAKLPFQHELTHPLNQIFNVQLYLVRHKSATLW